MCFGQEVFRLYIGGFNVIRVSTRLKITSMTSLDIGNEDVPREHKWHAEDSRKRTITIDEALSLSFKQESEEQVSDIRRELVFRKSDNKSIQVVKISLTYSYSASKRLSENW